MIVLLRKVEGTAKKNTGNHLGSLSVCAQRKKTRTSSKLDFDDKIVESSKIYYLPPDCCSLNGFLGRVAGFGILGEREL